MQKRLLISRFLSNKTSRSKGINYRPMYIYKADILASFRVGCEIDAIEFSPAAEEMPIVSLLWLVHKGLSSASFYLLLFFNKP
jgi:hypothetical protein